MQRTSVSAGLLRPDAIDDRTDEFTLKPGFLGLPLLNGSHSPANVCFIAYLLGCASGFGCFYGFVYSSSLGFFIGFMSAFHALEYLSTSMYQRDVTLNGTPH
jgi:hypothetical protein